MNRDSERIYDEFLVAAARAGDRQATSRLVARWQPRILRHAWRVLGDAERARDVAQESWIEILRGLARLDDVAAFPAWAYRIVTRRCQRTFDRTPETTMAPDTLEASIDNRDREAAAAPFAGERAADLASVATAIAALPSAQRATLALFYLEEMSVAEIAVATDVPPGTVKTRLMHARQKVRALLEGPKP